MQPFAKIFVTIDRTIEMTAVHFQTLYLALLLGFCMLHAVNAECNTCGVDSNLACVSETDYRWCTDGEVAGPITKCPANTVCSTTGSCQEKGEGVVAPCADCDQCDPTNTFVCKGPRQFALCLGTGQASDIIGECKSGYVCSLNVRSICGAVADGNTPSCSPTLETTAAPTTPPTQPTQPTTSSTTPSPSSQPTAYCNYVKARGRFPVGTDLATTCRQYLLCMDNNDVWVGVLYYCPNRLYFDDSTRACTADTPARCTAGVNSLSLFDISLV